MDERHEEKTGDRIRWHQYAGGERYGVTADGLLEVAYVPAFAAPKDEGAAPQGAAEYWVVSEAESGLWVAWGWASDPADAELAIREAVARYPVQPSPY